MSTAILAAGFAVALAACGGSEREALAAARLDLQKHDAMSAMVRLKTVLQARPDAGEARLLLGQTYAELGDPQGAEAEYRRALEAGVDALQVAPRLAQVLLEQRRAGDVIKEFAALDGDDKLALAELKAQLALAHLTEGQLDQAQAAAARAQALAPDAPLPQIVQVRLQAAHADPDTVRAAAVQCTQRWPDEPQAWVLLGDLAAAAGDTAQAIASYREALQRRPDLGLTHMALISVHLAANDVPSAQAQWQRMDQALPGIPPQPDRFGNPLTLYAGAVLALSSGDALRARTLSGYLLRSNPSHVRVLLVAGQAEMRLQSWRAAQNLFWRAIVASAKMPEPRLLAAQAHLAIGQADRALAALEPLVLKGSTQRQALILAAEARQMLGEQTLARELYARAAALKPGDPAVRTALALSRLGQSGERAVADELQSIALEDHGTRADRALYSVLVERKDWAGAAKALDRLAAKQPRQPQPLYLRGQLAALQGDASAARQHWQAAVALAPGFFPAVDGLAGLDVAAGQVDQAIQRYEALIKADPGSGRAWMMLAALKVKAGNTPQSVTGLLERAVKADPADPAPRVALIDHLTTLGEFRQALTVSQAAIAVMPDAPEVLASQGRLFMANGDYEQAGANFTRLAAMSQRSAKAYLMWSEAQIASGKVTSGNDSVRRAIELDPDALPVQRAAIALAMRERKPARALAIARQVQQQRPQDATGFLFEGDIAAEQQDWAAAAAAYRAALTRPNPGTAAMRLHLTLVNAGQAQEAERFAMGWVAQHPGDVDLRFQLGDMAHLRGDWAGAEAHYRAVLVQRPQHGLAMNNLADVLQRQGKPGVLELAEQAAKLLPKDARVLDTLAMALAAAGQFPRALDVQTQAVALARDQPVFRLHLAKIHLQAGDKAAARTELARLADLGDAFPGQREVASLQAAAGR